MAAQDTSNLFGSIGESLAGIIGKYGDAYITDKFGAIRYADMGPEIEPINLGDAAGVPQPRPKQDATAMQTAADFVSTNWTKIGAVAGVAALVFMVARR